MNALELVRRQMLRQMAIKEARLVQLTYRGNTYVKAADRLIRSLIMSIRFVSTSPAYKCSGRTQFRQLHR